MSETASERAHRIAYARQSLDELLTAIVRDWQAGDERLAELRLCCHPGTGFYEKSVDWERQSVRNHHSELIDLIDGNLLYYVSDASRYRLLDLRDRIDPTIDPRSELTDDDLREIKHVQRVISHELRGQEEALEPGPYRMYSATAPTPPPDAGDATPTPPAGSLKIDTPGLTAYWVEKDGGNERKLAINAHAEYRVLAVLCETPNGLVSHADLLRAARPTTINNLVEDMKEAQPEVRAALTGIRKALQDAGCPWPIKSVRGKGYHLVQPA